MPKLPGIPHLQAVRALEKAGFRVVRESKHIVMSDGRRILTIPAHERGRGAKLMATNDRCRPLRRRGCPAAAQPRMEDLASIVKFYRTHYVAGADAELQTFVREPSLAAAVRRAGLAQRPDGKRYDHQRRLSPHTLEAMLQRLQRAPLAGCRSFHELYEVVEGAIAPVPGVGELAVYDTTLRIGAKLGLEPDRVYLHVGTRLGARRLGLDWRAPFLMLKSLPRELRMLPAAGVEDILCIFKDRLGRGAAQ